VIPTLIFSYLFYNNLSKQTLDFAINSSEKDISTLSNDIIRELDSFREEILFLSETIYLHELINSKNQDEINIYKKKLALVFLELAKQKKEYYQIRYIDENGDEKIRINSNGEDHIIPEENLQNKKSSHYFQETIKLNIGEVFISPLDLNVENGIIENRGTDIIKEYIPVIRFAVPVFSEKNENKGIIVTNVYGRYLTEEISKNENLNNKTFLINKEGYYLYNIDKSKEWGFILDNQKNLKIENPLVFAEISRDRKGVFYDKNSNSYIVYESIPVDNSTNWIVAKTEKTEEVLLVFKNFFKRLVLLILFFVFIFSIVIIYISESLSGPIKKLQQGIEVIQKGNLDYKVNTNTKDEIGELSRAFDDMVNTVKESRIDIDRKVSEQTLEIVQKKQELENVQRSILNVLEDVESERQKTVLEKEKINTILQSIGDGVFVVNKNRKIIIFNKEAENITGFSKEEALSKPYKDILNFINEKDRKTNYGFIEKAFSSGKIQTMKGDTLLIKKDNSEIPVADSSAPIKDKNDEIIGCVVVFRDATKERQIDQMKSDFVSTASHQLRTPLTGIQWVSERLLKKSSSLPEKDKQYVNDINMASKRLSTLVDSLLNVSRIEGGRINIKPENIELIDFIQGYLKETTSLMEKKNIKMVFDEHPEKMELTTDRSALRNIIQSLVSNAIEYTPDNGKINISVEDSENDFLFKIKDTGIGIPLKDQKTIFNKFTRGSNALQVKTDGTGFGLYITRETVKLLEGKIHFDSIENKGTTFYVTLPKKAKPKEGGKSFV